jgi:hypothetical protein
MHRSFLASLFWLSDLAEDIQTHRQQCDLISLLPPDMETRLKKPKSLALDGSGVVRFMPLPLYP